MLSRGPAVQWGKSGVCEGTLWLQGTEVGRVVLRGRDGSWRFGRFLPGAGFGPFAASFAAWSRLMDDADAPLSDSQRAELAALERAIDRWQALLVGADGTIHRVRQLNIDGDLIEWKE